VQYRAIRDTERLAEIGAIGSVSSRGYSYNNAVAESLIGLFQHRAGHVPRPLARA
jgi:putative transposase